jgi:hypothetical protein
VFLCFPGAAYLDSWGPQAAEDANACLEKLIDVFNLIEHFFQRLERRIASGITVNAAMTGMIVEIIVEVINILAIATKEVKSGLLSELMSFMLTIRDSNIF